MNMLASTLAIGAILLAAPAVASTMQPINSFEAGPSSSTDCVNPITTGQVCTFKGGGTNVSVTNSVSPPVARPGAASGNNVLTVDANALSFFGFLDYFAASDGSWGSQDWTGFDTISFWMYGANSGTQMFVDILDNRFPGSTTDDAERYTATFIDDFAGWKKLEFDFDTFVRKEIGNGAPNDGLGLNEMWGYSIGGLDTNGAVRLHFDDVMISGPHVDTVVPLPAGLPLLGGGLVLLAFMSRRRSGRS